MEFVLAGELFAQLGRCGDDEVLESVECFRSGAYGADPGDAQHPQHFGDPVGGLGVAEVFASQHDRGRAGGINTVGLAVAGAALPVGAANLGDPHPGSA